MPNMFTNIFVYVTVNTVKKNESMRNRFGLYNCPTYVLFGPKGAFFNEYIKRFIWILEALCLLIPEFVGSLSVVHFKNTTFDFISRVL